MLQIDPGPAFAYQVLDGLWIGSAPPIRSAHEDNNSSLVGMAAFDTLILCAAEYQPSPGLFPVRETISAPMEDAFEPISDINATAATKAAKHVIARLSDKKQVLVTCLAGRNRSGLVCALALCFGNPKMSAVAAIESVRKARGHYALANPFFVEFIKSIAK